MNMTILLMLSQECKIVKISYWNLTMIHLILDIQAAQ
jgi:hypothetical protein